ncbi:ArsR/SmtB family transcription factor [Halovulum sp. GXIMD14793]
MTCAQDAKLDRTFAALADPTRRRIVRRLLQGDATVTDLAEPFDMSLAAVSKHIATLTQAGLITQRREGRTKWCQLEADSLHEASIWMTAFGNASQQDFDRLEQTLQQLGLVEEDH